MNPPSGPGVAGDPGGPPAPATLKTAHEPGRVHPVIPIHDEHACAGRQPLRNLPPQLIGQAPQLHELTQALQREISAPAAALLPGEPLGAWLRALHLEPGLADVRLAAELGCRGQRVAAVTFDILRARLSDTDIYVSLEKPSQEDQRQSA